MIILLCGDDSLQPDDCTIQREAVAAVFIGGVECDECAVGIVHGAGVGLRIGMGHHVVAQHGGRVARGIGADRGPARPVCGLLDDDRGDANAGHGRA